VLDSARAAGCTISLDLASFEVVNAARDWLLGQFRRGIDIAFANEDEIRALFQDDASDYPTLARRLAGLGVLAAVKVGKDGAWLAHGDTLLRVPGGGLQPRRHQWRRGCVGGRFSLWASPGLAAGRLRRARVADGRGNGPLSRTNHPGLRLGGRP